MTPAELAEELFKFLFDERPYTWRVILAHPSTWLRVMGELGKNRGWRALAHIETDRDKIRRGHVGAIYDVSISVSRDVVEDEFVLLAEDRVTKLPTTQRAETLDDLEWLVRDHVSEKKHESWEARVDNFVIVGSLEFRCNDCGFCCAANPSIFWGDSREEVTRAIAGTEGRTGLLQSWVELGKRKPRKSSWDRLDPFEE